MAKKSKKPISSQKNKTANKKEKKVEKKKPEIKKESKKSKSVSTKNTKKSDQKDIDKKTDLKVKNHVIINDSKDPKAKWYVIHTYSGHENKVAQALKQRVEAMNQTDYVHELLIPTENKIKVNKGKKHTLAEKIFPGYMLVKMILTDESWLTIRTTNGVTSFVGVGNKPTPISKKEVEAIKKFMEQEAPKYKATFTVGEAVKIIDGPFNDFLGNVESIDHDKGKVKVLVSIFGRETPVELDFLQVQNI